MTSKYGCSLYRFVNDAGLKPKIEEWGARYGFGHIDVLAGDNYYSFLNDVIDNCPDDHALISCNDLTWPIGLDYALDGAIESAGMEFGAGLWGALGNCGMEFFSNKPHRYIRNYSSTIIPASSGKPRAATFLDRNTLLLNIANLRRHGVRLPADLRGTYLHGLVLVMECCKKGLISAVDSHLYVLDLSDFDQSRFDREGAGADFERYMRKSFINKTIITTNGPINVNNDIRYLIDPRTDSRPDYYGLVDSLVRKAYTSREKKTVTIVTRTMLNRMNRLFRLLDSVRMAALYGADRLALKIMLAVNNSDPDTRDSNLDSIFKSYPDLDISVSDSTDRDQYPRVCAMKTAVNRIHDDSSFVWFVDDDDFIYPESLQHLPAFLTDNIIFIGDSAILEERWEDGKTFPVKSKKVGIYKSDLHHECIMGENKIPVCSVIYPVAVVKQVFDKFRFMGDYNEDYALYLVASCSCDVVSYPMLVAGISYHGANTIGEKDKTHWHHSYTAFVSEIVEKKVLPTWVYHFIQEKSREIAGLRDQINGARGEQPQINGVPRKRWWGRRMEQSFRRFRKAQLKKLKDYLRKS